MDWIGGGFISLFLDFSISCLFGTVEVTIISNAEGFGSKNDQ